MQEFVKHRRLQHTLWRTGFVPDTEQEQDWPDFLSATVSTSHRLLAVFISRRHALQLAVFKIGLVPGSVFGLNLRRRNRSSFTGTR